MSISTTAISASFLHRHIRLRRRTFSRAKPPPTPPFQFLCLASSNSGESEESRWLREEQRWLREEQRWLREESRWNSERESLLREISALRLRLEQLESELENRNSISDSLSQIASVLQTSVSLPSPQSDSLALSSSSSSSSPLPPEIADRTVKEETIEEENLSKHAKDAKKDTKLRSKTLRIGSEGDEVRLMQETLLKLGFYSGEEDMEYSTFSLGTDVAVKTWQSSLGVAEDGVMTDELLKRLYSSQLADESDPLGNANGAALASVTESAEISKQTVVKKEGNNTEVSKQRVYLVGENRWEEPSRLIGNDKQGGTKKVQGSSVKCLVCRGEGRLLCTECDGTGEPNIEPQFLEWLDEGAKCTYCEGLGYIACDTCEGK